MAKEIALCSICDEPMPRGEEIHFACNAAYELFRRSAELCGDGKPLHGRTLSELNNLVQCLREAGTSDSELAHNYQVRTDVAIELLRRLKLVEAAVG